MTRVINMQDLKNCDELWRKLLNDRGYSSICIEWEVEPIQDKVTLNLSWYNTEWSMSSLIQLKVPRATSLSGLAEYIDTITMKLRQLPVEEQEREQALLRDYAKVKERIEASNLSALVKAEAARLMEALSTNILPPPTE